MKGLLALGAGVAVYALKIEPLHIEVTHTELVVPNLPESWDGTKILLLADPHVWEFGARERRVVASLADGPRPDVIVWAGDFLGATRGVIPAVRLVDEVSQHFPQVPTYGILGNAEHKIRTVRLQWLLKKLRAVGVEILINEWSTLTLRGETVTIAGTDDPYYGHADLAKTLDGAPEGRFTLLLAHSPQIVAEAARAGANLMLSGHTHGGQVRVPGFGALRTQNPLSRRIDCGAFDTQKLGRILGQPLDGELSLYISRGIGLAYVPRLPWLAPRLNCRPEVAYLTLRRLVR